MSGAVAITGIGLVTPLGQGPGEVLRRLEAGESAAGPPRGFDPRPFSCRLAAEIAGFEPERFVPDPKAIRLMNRDGLLAAAAARLALEDAGVRAGREYLPEEIALFGSTGLAGLELEEVAPLIRGSAGPGGVFDPCRFGRTALKRVRPILSFKILSNMPLCFVSIFEGIQGPNGIYNPWEGQGARAIERGIRAVRRGEAPCALVGGCDAKVHELAFLSLEQAGAFDSWRETGRGAAPGEGAAFLVLEDEERALGRGARIRARLRDVAFRTAGRSARRADLFREMLGALSLDHRPLLISSEEGDGLNGGAEEAALRSLGIRAEGVLRPKVQAGNLFAAAAALQVGLAAAMAEGAGPGSRVVASCFGHGSEKAAFLLGAA